MELAGPGFRSGPIRTAPTWRTRWRGLMGRTPHPLLLSTRSVHGFWMRQPVWAVGLDAELEVVGVRTLRRRRIVSFRRARAILELPLTVAPPRPGTRLRWLTEEREDRSS